MKQVKGSKLFELPRHYKMLRDDDLYPMTARIASTGGADASPVEEISQFVDEENYANDDLDSIFGSAPPSPILAAQEPSSSSSPRPNDSSRNERRRSVEVSDVPRLKEKHETEGYRDGVTQGKGQSIQAGFDEGYSLGAVLGLRIGKMLGLLEGIAAAVRAAGGDAAENVERSYQNAIIDLKTENVFGKDYWGEDGIWLWSVPGEEKGGDVVFEDVVGAHPLVDKWEKLVQEEVVRWGVDLSVWEGEEGREDSTFDIAAKGKQAKPQKDVIAEVVPAAGQILGVARNKLSW